MRDSQKQRLYNAEKVLWPKRRPESTVYSNIDQIRRRIQEISGSSTFMKWYGWTAAATVEVFHGHDCHQQYNRITLSRWGFNEPCLLHELAHVILWNRYAFRQKPADYAHHGWEFAATLLDLVWKWMSPEAEHILRAEFKRLKVKTRPRRTLNLTDEQRQARRVQFLERLAATRRAKR
jgi:hypothetical protein